MSRRRSGRFGPGPTAAGLVASSLALAVVLLAGLIRPVPAAAESSMPAARTTSAADEPEPVGFLAPVDAPVLDPFRAPSTRYGPGNRGLEYGTRPGDLARAPAAGVVAYAGAVAGRLVVSVVHPDGLRSTLTGLAVVVVRVGDVVARSSVLGTTGDRLHFGVRRGDVYLDPATLFSTTRGRPRHGVLVPSITAR